MKSNVLYMISLLNQLNSNSIASWCLDFPDGESPPAFPGVLGVTVMDLSKSGGRFMLSISMNFVGHYISWMCFVRNPPGHVFRGWILPHLARR